AVGGVVELEDDVAAGLDKAPAAGFECLCGHPGSKAGKHVAGQFLAFTLGIEAGNERDSGLLVSHPLRTGFADEGDYVMDDAAGAWPDFGGLHPAVLGELIRKDDVLVFNGTGGGNVESLRHLEDLLGLADVPPGHKLAGRRKVTGIALRGA